MRLSLPLTEEIRCHGTIVTCDIARLRLYEIKTIDYAPGTSSTRPTNTVQPELLDVLLKLYCGLTNH